MYAPEKSGKQASENFHLKYIYMFTKEFEVNDMEQDLITAIKLNL